MHRAFEEYRDRYAHVRMARRDGVLELRLHTNGGPMVWSGPAHDELGFAFQDVADDPDNRVVIITGEGDAFCATADPASFGEMDVRGLFGVHTKGIRLFENLLKIPVPVIGAVNGPALIHAELVLLSNIVIATPDAAFQDAVHFDWGLVPGDGVHITFPALLGPTRGAYFLLTNEPIECAEALRLGLVHEVVDRDQLTARAWQLAEQIARKPVMANYFTRRLLSERLRRAVQDHLSHGIALEGLAMLDGSAPT
jgi:enoyl-CoA hydratase/carnithine racemase